mmetsp:Transcript_13105/g.59172  ORF Transcript_13105/g.59172 Transcript_13105/m.59172 type:complete len:263 (-) Transcript_13105:2825-3613(-)
MQMLQQRGRQLQVLSMLVQTELLRLRLHSAQYHQGQDAPPKGHLPEVLGLVVVRLLPQVPQGPDVPDVPDVPLPQVLHLLPDVASVLQGERPIRGLPASVRLGLRVRRMQGGHHLPLVLLLPLRRDRRPQLRRQVRAQANPRQRLRRENLRLHSRGLGGSLQVPKYNRRAQGGDHGDAEVSDADVTRRPRYILHRGEPRHRVDQLTAQREIITSETPRLSRVEARAPLSFPRTAPVLLLITCYTIVSSRFTTIGLLAAVNGT